MKIISNGFYCCLLSLAIVFASCRVINPEEEIPAYIQVDSIGVYTTPVSQGTASSNLSDVWVSVDGIFLSGYQLGTKIPVLYNGAHSITLRAGILLNGIEGSRAPYAVFQSFDTLMNLQPGVVHNLVPRVTYLSFTQFPLIEDFDHDIHFSTPVTSAPLMLEPNSFENNGGLVILDGQYPSFECMTVDSFDLPGGTVPTFVEINYKCNTEFSVGVKANTNLGPLDYLLLHVRETDTWKKIYVNLTSIASQAQHATDWKIYMKASLEDGHATDTLRFDNIKLVY
jgi:hypothetical protein